MALPLAAFFTGGLFAKVLAFVLAGTALRIITAIGLTVVTYTGIDLVLTEITNQYNSNIAGVGPYVLSMMELYGVTFFFTTILSTMTGILAVKSLISLKRIVVK